MQSHPPKKRSRDELSNLFKHKKKKTASKIVWLSVWCTETKKKFIHDKEELLQAGLGEKTVDFDNLIKGYFNTALSKTS